MYIRRNQLWWLIPIFLGLFLLGMLLAVITKPPQTTPASSSMEEKNQGDPDTLHHDQLASLVKKLAGDTPVTYQVKTRDQTYQGVYRGESFDVKGNVSGHIIQMKRSTDKVELQVDGKEQPLEFLPYALFTPYEHAMIIQGQLHSLVPTELHKRDRDGLKGLQFALPSNQVESMISLWLGPQFQADEIMRQTLKDVVIRYELWYDTDKFEVKQLTVDLLVPSFQNQQRDQLVFRF
ncbi:hypothetical protein [Brevibacillus sp. SYSU BS000544]|uniref:hypothetical protein n=1 Tax=Brevibacillus sp. SYSU BS000544 TaxID=3416443 RepID=UPI003CE5A367